MTTSEHTTQTEHIDWETRARAAERTVEVLKDQVQRLYNGDGLHMQDQLNRAVQRQERARQRQELLLARQQELEAEVAFRTRELKRILDNVTSGFLVLDRNGCVQPGFTRSCKSLLSPDISSKTRFVTLLDISDRDGFEFDFAISQLFEDVFPEELTIEQMPGRFERKDGRVLKMDYSVLRSDDGQIEGLLTTIQDITQLEQAQQESAHNHMLLNILRDRESFEMLINDFKQLVSDARKALDLKDQVTVRRLVHTIKGNCGSFGLLWLVWLVHEIEAQATIDEKSLDTIEQSMKDFLKREENVLNVHYDKLDSAIFIQQANLSVLKDLSSRLGSDESSNIHAWIEHITRRPARTLLGPIEEMIDSLAKRLEKFVDFEVKGADLAVDTRTLAPLFRNLIHVLRNAMDHGLEPPHLRGDKSETGKLKLSIEQAPHDLIISIEDDGRGIDTDKLTRRAIDQGLISIEQADQLTPAERYELIFEDRFSTAISVSDISGRGVGLSAVKMAVEDMGGKILVSSQVGRGTSFRIIVPHSMIVFEMNQATVSGIYKAVDRAQVKSAKSA